MNDEILKQILDEIKVLGQGQARLETSVSQMDTRMSQMDANISQMDARMSRLERDLKNVKETADANRASLINIEVVQFKKIETALDIAIHSEDRIVDHEKRITFIEDEVQLIKAAL